MQEYLRQSSVFTKTGSVGSGGTDKVWFYDMKADGFSLDDKRQEIKENDIPDIIERFNHLELRNRTKENRAEFLCIFGRNCVK